MPIPSIEQNVSTRNVAYWQLSFRTGGKECIIIFKRYIGYHLLLVRISAITYAYSLTNSLVFWILRSLLLRGNGDHNIVIKCFFHSTQKWWMYLRHSSVVFMVSDGMI